MHKIRFRCESDHNLSEKQLILAYYSCSERAGQQRREYLKHLNAAAANASSSAAGRGGKHYLAVVSALGEKLSARQIQMHYAAGLLGDCCRRYRGDARSAAGNDMGCKWWAIRRW